MGHRWARRSRRRNQDELIRDLGALNRGVAEGSAFRVVVEHACALAAARLPGLEIRYVDFDDGDDAPLEPGTLVEVVRATEQAVGALVAWHRNGPIAEGHAALIGALAQVLSAAASRDAQAAALDRSIRVDPLTRVLNRVGLTRQLAQLLDAAHSGQMLAVFAIDIDNFRAVNESFGYAAGDAVLRETARRLAAAIGSEGHVARTEGDAFVVVARVHGHETIEHLATRLQTAIRAPIALQGPRAPGLNVTACLGYVVALPGADLVDIVLRDATSTLESARRRGHGAVCFVDEDIRRSAESRQFLAEHLPIALRDGQLHAVYQPIVDVGTKELVGAEALVRWTDRARGPISPIALISAAERLGLVHVIGEQMLEQALAQLARWRRSNIVSPRFTMSVNVSPTELASPHLATKVRALLDRHRVPASRLCLEITEDGFIDDLANCARTAASLRTMGVKIAIDDFGVGYSSLAYLDRLPLDCLKIDRSFVERVETVSGSRAIIAGVTALSRELGLAVVAEGVERTTQLAAIAELKCDRAQGFLIGRPMGGDEIETWVTSGRHEWVAGVGAPHTGTGGQVVRLATPRSGGQP
jgi:diguanylate cyclase (GGDEF)-like protein